MSVIKKSRGNFSMKRKIVGLLVLALILLSACGKEQKDDAHNHDHNHESGIHLRVGLSAHEGEPMYAAVEQFAKEVHTKSDGAIEVTLYGSNQLGSDEELLASVAEKGDKVDIVISDITNFTAYDAKIDISKMPFAFASYQEAREFMASDIQKEAEYSLQKHNMQVLTHYTGGFHQLTLKGKMLNGTKDLQGEFIATSSRGIGDVAMKALGAMTEKYDINQLQQVLQQGHCKGYEGTLDTIYNNRIYQGQEYLVVTNHCFDSYLFVIADSVWSALGDEYQKIIKDAANTSSSVEYQLMEQQEKEMIEKIKSAGIRIQYPNQKIFWEKVEPVVKNYSSNYGGLTDRLINWKSER